jgi:hypothetical protein
MSINKFLQPSHTKATINDNTGTVTVRSYQHASRIFVDGNYRLSPKYGFLFYVEFDFDPLITNVSNISAQELGMIVKSVNLPKFSVETKIHNAYNRKNIVQNKINYDPVTITFHDDQADNVRNFWYDYYSFFYRDSDYADSTYNIISKYQERPSFDWGYSPRPVGSYNSANAYQSYQYIQAIRIYSLYQKNFSEYELINPTIQSFRHGEHQQGDNNLLEHQMTVQYESVKYQTGYTTTNTVGGYVDLHYDNTPSPIAPVNGTDLVDNGQGGVTKAPGSVLDLANYNLQTAGGAVVPSPNGGALSAGVSFGSIIGGAIVGSAGAATNAGGFSIPAIGSMNSGMGGGNIIGQQLNAAAVSVAGQSAATLANGVVGGIASGITQATGVNGGTVIGLVAGAITNPAGTLRAVENMAVGYATRTATSAINVAVSQASAKIGESISQTVSSSLGDLNASLGSSLFGEGTTFSAGLGQLPSTLMADFNSLTNDVDLSAVDMTGIDTSSLGDSFDASSGWSM